MSTRKSLLLVDSDARSLRVLEVSLRKAGFSVNTAESGASALQWAFTEPPDLVISDTKLPDMTGFDLCQRLRSDNRTRAAVVVFLTDEASPDSKIAGINAGADDFLPKPVLVKEIVSRVKTLIEKRRTDSIARRERPGNLSGTLSNMGVVDLLQVMEAGQKSGIVHLSSDPIKSGGFVTDGEERGTIFFRDGEVIDARLGRLAGLEAVYRMLLWDDGVFEIEFKNIAREDAIQTSTQAILLEGMRRVDEWSRISDLIPAVNSRLTIDYNALSRAYPAVPPEMKPVLHLFDGRRTVFEVVSDTPGDDAIALSVIADLHRYGILQAAHRDVGESAVEAWLSTPPAMATDPGLPSALANAVIPSPHTPSQILGSDGEPTLVGHDAYVRRDATQRTVLPEPLTEPSLILSRHTVPANRAVPLTKDAEPAAPDPILLTQTRPQLRIQRMSSVVAATPVLAEAPASGARSERLRAEAGRRASPERSLRFELEEDDDGWEPVRTAPSVVPPRPNGGSIPAAKSGAFVLSRPPERAPRVAPAGPPAWPVADAKRPAPAPAPAVPAPAVPDRPQEVEAATTSASDFDPASSAEWYSKSEGKDEFNWEGLSSPWRSRIPGILLVLSTAALVSALIWVMKRPHADLATTEPAPAGGADKRATWPKTDETAVMIRSAAVPATPPAETPPPAVEAPPAPKVAGVAVAPPAPPPPVAAPPPPAPKVDKAAAEEAAKRGDTSLDSGNLKAAQQEFKRAVDADPENAAAHAGLALAYAEIGNDRAARVEARTALKLDAANARAYLVHALLAANVSDKETANKYYKKYLQLAPHGKHADEVRRILSNPE